MLFKLVFEIGDQWELGQKNLGHGGGISHDLLNLDGPTYNLPLEGQKQEFIGSDTHITVDLLLVSSYDLIAKGRNLRDEIGLYFCLFGFFLLFKFDKIFLSFLNKMIAELAVYTDSK